MSSLAELPELVGSFSYSRKDDEHSAGALSRLRLRIHSELRLQLGRDFRLWQDTAAIPEGALWEDEIKRAIGESVFFIPIVTPSAATSAHCRVEFQSFLAREAELGRHDLVFPILYIHVPELEREELWRQDDLLRIIGGRAPQSTGAMSRPSSGPQCRRRAPGESDAGMPSPPDASRRRTRPTR